MNEKRDKVVERTAAGEIEEQEGHQEKPLLEDSKSQSPEKENLFKSAPQSKSTTEEHRLVLKT